VLHYLAATNALWPLTTGTVVSRPSMTSTSHSLEVFLIKERVHGMVAGNSGPVFSLLPKAITNQMQMLAVLQKSA
jgi:hypothetical protein